MRIASEGYRVASPFMVLTVIGIVWGSATGTPTVVAGTVVCGVLTIALLMFFRDPKRRVPEGDDLVLAPADGRVLLTERGADGRQRIAIFLSVFNVHVNRNPVSGTVMNVKDRPGNYFNAATDAAGEKNARVDVDAETPYGLVSWCQVSGLIARKITCRLAPGAKVSAGARFGLIFFGSRMEVLLPDSAQVTTRVGECVVAGETIIAKFSHEDSA